MRFVVTARTDIDQILIYSETKGCTSLWAGFCSGEEVIGLPERHPLLVENEGIETDMSAIRWSRILWAVIVVALVATDSTSNVHAQGLGGPLSDFLGASNQVKPTLNATLQQVDNKTVQLNLEVSFDSTAYTYAQTSEAGTATRISIEAYDGIEVSNLKFHSSKKPKVVIEPLFDNARLKKLHGGTTWIAQIPIKPGAMSVSLKGQINLQVCNATTCNPFDLVFEEALAIKAMPATLSSKPVPTTVEVIEDVPSKPKPPIPTEIDHTASEILPAALPFSDEIRPARPGFDGDGQLEPDPVVFRVRMIPASPAKGEMVMLGITAVLDPKWKLYAIDQDPEMHAVPTSIYELKAVGLEPVQDGFIPHQLAEEIEPDQGVIQKVHKEEITWLRNFKVVADSPEGIGLSGKVKYQLCDELTCLPENEIQFALGNAAQASIPVATMLVDPDPTQLILVKADSNEDELAFTDPADLSADPAKSKELIPFLLTGFGAGLLALLTPCVFPMIPVTISFFLKRSEKGDSVIGLATIYCLGIIGTFVFLGIGVSIVFGGTQMNALANHPLLNVFFGLVFVVFGLSLMGLFDLSVPSSVLTWSNSQQQRGGVIGVLFMAFTFTLVSFTCTFPFAGTLMTLAAQGDYYWPVLGMLSFSTAFALPFFFLSLFPMFLKKLPKSGGWMHGVKFTMGLVEIAFAFKFFSVADLSWNAEPFFFDYFLVMSSWMVITMVAGLHLLGMIKTHGHSGEASAMEIIFGISFLGLSAYLAGGIFGDEKPTGVVWQQIEAFAPPRFAHPSAIPHSAGGDNAALLAETRDWGPILSVEGMEDLPFALDVDQAIAFAKQNNKPLFFDFTGVNCVNCRRMEHIFANDQEIRSLLKEFVRVQLFVDQVPTIADSGERERLLELNRKRQEEWYKSSSLPGYAVVSPDGMTILSRKIGMQAEEGEFAQFLKYGLEQHDKLAANVQENNSNQVQTR